MHGYELEAAQNVVVWLVLGHGQVDVVAIHAELYQRVSLAIGLSIFGEEALALVDFQKDEFRAADRALCNEEVCD